MENPAQIDSLRRTLEDVLGPKRGLSRSASKRPKLGEIKATAGDQKKALLYNLMGPPTMLSTRIHVPCRTSCRAPHDSRPSQHTLECFLCLTSQRPLEQAVSASYGTPC